MILAIASVKKILIAGSKKNIIFDKRELIRNKRGMGRKLYNKLIFVVDDDMPSYQLIAELFYGYEVTLRHFVDGRKMMECFKREDIPDMVIMDIQLPGINGLKLTEKIKSMYPAIPVIAYTSCAMPGDRDRCLNAGCDEYISKPINVETFIDTVSQHF